MHDGSANHGAAEPDGELAPVILYDGRCGLCDRTVAFVLARDRARRFRFAALESEYAGQRLLTHGIDPGREDTVVLVEGDRAWTRSAAALRIAGGLPLPWSLAKGLLVVPRFLRDGVYDWVARHRYRWFGRRESCRAPAPEDAERFLD